MVEINDSTITLRETDVDGVFPWFWQTSDQGAWQGPHEEWIPFKQMYLRHVRKFDVCVQAGGNHGLYPRLFSNMFNHVYTFEPDFKNFRCLVLNCHKPNIYKFNAALGDVRKMIHLNADSEQNTGTHAVAADHKGGFIPQLRIDDFDFHACDLIQLDIEGYEGYALQGALETIDKFRPVIVVESCRDVYLDMLRPWNYQVMEGHNSDTLLAPQN